MSDSSLGSPLLPQVVDSSATKPLTLPTVPLWRNLIFTLLQIAMDMIASIPMMLPLFRGVKCTYIPTAFAYMSIFLTLNIFATLLLVYNNLKRAQKGPYRARRDCDNTDVGLVYSGDTFVQIFHRASKESRHILFLMLPMEGPIETTFYCFLLNRQSDGKYHQNE